MTTKKTMYSEDYMKSKALEQAKEEYPNKEFQVIDCDSVGQYVVVEMIKSSGFGEEIEYQF